MIDRDRIAYLQELAISHFNDGNVSAALSAWKQVLELDPTNVEAQRGMALAGQQGGAAPFGGGGGGEMDADATMMFSPDQMSQLAGQPAPAGGSFDADSTMLFGAPAPGASPARAPGGGFDGESTMLFGGAQAAPAPAPTPAPAPGGFDPASTMMFTPPAAPAAPAAPSFAPPPAAPSFAPPPAAPSFGAPPEAPSFGLPPAAPSFGPPPAAPSFGPPPADLPSFGTPPPAAGGGGFSFELPPPPAAKPGGSFGLPELPSLGPAPTFTPAPPPAPAASAPKRSGAQFGEIDAGDAEALAVPTIGVAEGAAAAPTAEDAKAREEEMKRRYEQEFGKSSAPATSPLPRPAQAAAAPKSKLPLILGIVFVGLMGTAWIVIKYVVPKSAPEVVQVPVKKDPNAGLTKPQAEQKIIETLARASEALRKGDINAANGLVGEARQVAVTAGIPVPAAIDTTASAVEFEQQYRAKFEKAQRRFCVEDYPTANILFSELEQAKPSDPEPGKYIERIYYNLGITELQKKTPWEAVYYFDVLASRNPNDQEAKELGEFARAWPVGSNLGYAYSKRVDPLTDRTAGCR